MYILHGMCFAHAHVIMSIDTLPTSTRVHTVVSWANTHSRVSTHVPHFKGSMYIAASIQMYGVLIPGKRPSGPKLRVMLKRPLALTRDTTVYTYLHDHVNDQCPLINA